MVPQELRGHNGRRVNMLVLPLAPFAPCHTHAHAQTRRHPQFAELRADHMIPGQQHVRRIPLPAVVRQPTETASTGPSQEFLQTLLRDMKEQEDRRTEEEKRTRSASWVVSLIMVGVVFLLVVFLIVYLLRSKSAKEEKTVE